MTDLECDLGTPSDLHERGLLSHAHVVLAARLRPGGGCGEGGGGGLLVHCGRHTSSLTEAPGPLASRALAGKMRTHLGSDTRVCLCVCVRAHV